ncbi:MAG: polymerase subunit delta [Pyrinomonadaceae bacterium]|jgi:DNA polymerase-3 subunit delta|nr:polymerase subunit delta [Pyrinomonadaceae bacterium]MDQ1728563.1 polymerase subunit delta [Pyrinomonadaceae bacterium]
MTILSRTEFDRSVQANPAGRFKPLYLLLGTETFLRDNAAHDLTEAALGGTLLREFNEASFSLLNDSARAAISAAEQLPLMAGQRVVKLRDFARLREADEEIIIRYLDRPVDSTVMIFVADDLDKRKKLTKALLGCCAVVEFKTVNDGEAKAWARTRLRELKTTADDRVLTEIVRLVGTDLRTLSSEVDKLTAAALGTRQITMELVAELIGHSRDLSNFELGDFLLAGDRKRALETLHRLLDAQAAPVMLVGLIASNYHRLAIAKELDKRGARDEVKRMAYGSYEKREAFSRTVQRTHDTKIARCIQLIAAADLALKTSLGGTGLKGARLQLEVLVCELAS